MKKLHLDALRVDTFATTAAGDANLRGTVAGREAAFSATCPVSYGGTCWITCWDSCFCETEWEC
jgi:hypothetical protein